MSIDPQTAADIAARHGLSIDAAVSLRMLADTPEAAERIAAQFAPAPVDVNDAIRANSIRLLELQRRTDANGVIHPPTGEQEGTS